jgi:gas vesicle protein
MSEDSRAGLAYTLLGLLAGTVVGAAIALVYSPSNGEGNRKRLNQWAHNRLEEAQRRLERRS